MLRNFIVTPTTLTTCASRTLRPFKTPASRLLLIAVALSALGDSGCLRFGYRNFQRSDSTHDAGTRDSGTDAGASETGGHGGANAGAGSGGMDGSGGMAADGGTNEAGSTSPSDSGVMDSDASGMQSSDASTGGATPPKPDAGDDDDDDDDQGNMPDSGAADSGPIITSTLCPERPGALFCDSFEDPMLMRWSDGYTLTTNTTLARSMVRAHTGTWSLLAEITQKGAGTQARKAMKVYAKQTSGDAWLRFWSYVPTSSAITVHLSVGVLSELPMPYDGFELRLLPDHIDINSTAGVFQNAMQFPRDRWVCVELHVKIDATDGVYEVYFDGATTPTISSGKANTLPQDGFTAGEVGIHYADPNQGPAQVWVDDVVMSKSRFPCE